MIIEMEGDASGTSGSILRIEPLRINKDEARYSCIVENGLAEPVSADAALKVINGERKPLGCFMNNP